MEPRALLDSLRSLVLVVAHDGTVTNVAGDVGGLIGYPPEELLGRNSLDFVADRDRDALAEIFLGFDESITPRFPTPFTTHLIAADGRELVVDCLPTGSAPPLDSWVLEVTPRVLHAELDAIEQLSRGETGLSIAESMADRVTRTYDTGERSVGFVLHRPDRGVFTNVTAPNAPCDMVDGLRHAFDRGEAVAFPEVAVGEVVRLDSADLPIPLARVAAASDLFLASVGIAGIGDDHHLVMVTMSDYVAFLNGNNALVYRSVLNIINMALERSAARALLERAALTDELTGLANRSAFFASLRGGCEPIRTAVLYIDLDRFKSVNDRWGHSVGDDVLVETANRIAGICRSQDVVARLGGDEFAVLLRDTDDETAREIGQRIVAEIGRPLNSVVGPHRVTATSGLIHSPTTDDPDSWLRAADMAMLMGKRAGRDRLISVRG